MAARESQPERPTSRRRLVPRVILGALVGAVLSATFSLTLLPRRYDSRTTIVFPIPPDNRLNPLLALTGGAVFGPLEVPFGSALPILTYNALLRSDDVLLRAAADNGLQELYEIPSEERLLRFMRQVTSVEVSPERLLTIRVTLPGTTRIRSFADIADGAAAAERDRPTRQLVANVAQSLVKHMGDSAARLNLDAAQAGINVLRGQRDELEAQLEGFRDAQIAVQERLATADGASLAASLAQALSTAEATQRDADGQLRGLERRRTEVNQQMALLRANLRDLPDGLPLLAQQRQDYAAARTALDLAEQRWGPENAEVNAARQTAELAWERLEKAAQTASAGLTQELMSVEAEIAQVQGQLAAAREQSAALRQRASTMPGEAAELTRLSAQVLQYEARLARTEDQLREAESNYAARGLNWQVMDVARVPERKTAPSGVRFGLLGLFLGALLTAAKPAWRSLGALARQAQAEAEEAQDRAEIG